MIEISCQKVLLDIEGTVSPVAFVYDVMFPYAREQMAPWLRENWESDPVREALDLLARDHQSDSSAQWFASRNVESVSDRQNLVVESVHLLMDQDAKVTGLKQLQGLVWRSGFETGLLVADLFEDVLPCIRKWREAGLELFIYSSGSVAAQKLFFGHTSAGNLLTLFSGFFDTTTGNKKEPESYSRIVADKSNGHVGSRKRIGRGSSRGDYTGLFLRL